MNNIKSRSFTLLEMIIAMLILSLVTAGIVGLFISSYKFIIQAGRRLQAINYGRQVAETLKVYVSAANIAPAPAIAGTGPGCVLDEGTNPHNPTAIGLPTFDIPGITGETCTYTVDEDVTAGGVNTTLEEATITVTLPTE